MERKRRSIKEIRREELVDAAISLLSEKGWGSLSIDEIASRAGLSRSMVWYHFHNRDDVIESIIERCERMIAERRRVASAITDPVARLRQAVRTGLELSGNEPLAVKVLMYSGADPRATSAVQARIKSVYRDTLAYWTELVRLGQESGAYRAEIDAHAAAAQVIGIFSGLAIHWIADPGCYPFEHTIAQAEQMVLTFLSKAPKKAC